VFLVADGDDDLIEGPFFAKSTGESPADFPGKVPTG
jgi:hypothetical protein